MIRISHIQSNRITIFHGPARQQYVIALRQGTYMLVEATGGSFEQRKPNGLRRQSTCDKGTKYNQTQTQPAKIGKGNESNPASQDWQWQRQKQPT
jgi:hypothetical protein